MKNKLTCLALIIGAGESDIRAGQQAGGARADSLSCSLYRNGHSLWPVRSWPREGVASAAEAMARNPGAAAAIRFALILGLVLIESLALYTLVITYVAR